MASLPVILQHFKMIRLNSLDVKLIVLLLSNDILVNFCNLVFNVCNSIRYPFCPLPKFGLLEVL